MNQKVINVFKKIGKVFLTILGTVFFGFTASLIIAHDKKEQKKDEKEQAEKIKEETKNELEKKDAADIVADSPNQSTISTTISNEQADLRKRIKSRLE